MANIRDIEGIGDTYAVALEQEAGITTVEQLLAAGGAPGGRASIAEKVNVNSAKVLEWVNRADLSRIKGIATQYADLLEFAGVDSVPELAQRVPENLHARLTAINEEKNLTNRPPSLSEITSWVEQAKGLPRAVTH